MALDIHIVMGESVLLASGTVRGSDLADLIGPDVDAVPAEWIATDAGMFGHDFLLDHRDDLRIAVLAHAIARDYGARLQPCLIFPGLAEGYTAPAVEGSRSWAEVVVALFHGLGSQAGACRVILHAVAFRDRPVADIQAVVRWMQDLGVDAVQGSPLLPAPDSPLEAELQRNILIGRLADRVKEIAASSGLLERDQSAVFAACHAWLANRQAMGLTLDPNLSDAAMAALATHILNSLLTVSSGNRS